MFQSVQSLPEWLENKFILFSTLAWAYKPSLFASQERKPSLRKEISQLRLSENRTGETFSPSCKAV
jgi:hypothetical protein